MPWNEVSVMDQRREFVRLALQEGANRRELCRRFGISPDVGYKWLRRWQAGDHELADQLRRPKSMPKRSVPEVEARVLAVRDKHPAWGARKIAHCLKRGGQTVPVPSTVHRILCRNERIKPSEKAAPSPSGHRFERDAPNQLWQMDFKGHMPLADGRRCHPLTMVDDHSRYALCLQACSNEQGDTVRQQLERTFFRYGLPDAFLVDNGVPWGTCSQQRWTKLGVWLLKLGINVIHSRPYHPQTRGKNERFHRTLKAEVLTMQSFSSMREIKAAFDRWRHIYNHQRPHQALGQDVPASRYRPSLRSMPRKLPQPEYEPGAILRTVGTTKSYISFKGKLWIVPEAFHGERVAVRPLNADGA